MHDDPLSAASAGLLALGVERSRRAEALELLAAMIDLADEDGNVLLDGALFAVEQRMGVEPCLEVYGWLEELDVVSRTNNGWHIAAFDAHSGPAGETLASLEVLRRHLDSVGQAEVVPLATVVAADATESAEVVPLRKWRRAVPMAAAGLAASVAVVSGVARFVPQAAVTGRNAGQQSAARANTTVAPRSVAEIAENVNEITAPAGTPSTVRSTPVSAVGNTSTTGIATGLAGTVACAVPNVVTAVTKVDVVRLALAGERGETIWAAVVTGTATLTDASQGLLLPALEVVAHVVDGDTAPVAATLSAPLLLPNVSTPFSAVVALGTSKPSTAVTASAVPTGFKSC